MKSVIRHRETGQYKWIATYNPGQGRFTITFSTDYWGAALYWLCIMWRFHGRPTEDAEY